MRLQRTILPLGRTRPEGGVDRDEIASTPTRVAWAAGTALARGRSSPTARWVWVSAHTKEEKPQRKHVPGAAFSPAAAAPHQLMYWSHMPLMPVIATMLPLPSVALESRDEDGQYSVLSVQRP